VGPLLKGYIVIAEMVLQQPEVAVEVGEKEPVKWSLGESPGNDRTCKAAEPKGQYGCRWSAISRSNGRAVFPTGTPRQVELDGHGIDGEERPAPRTGRAALLKGQARDQPARPHFVGGSA